ncbi:MAG: hypothetical protein MJE77_26390 [Proteobacteria bacterium]|nr:hypothetical protein [Pseudomonadota bacterium]
MTDDHFYMECAVGFHDEFRHFIELQQRQNSILQRIRRHLVHHHNADLVMHQSGGTVERTAMQKCEAIASFARDVLESGDSDAFVKTIKEFSQEIRKQLSRLFYSRINEVCDKTGNVVDLKGEKLSPDSVCALFERIDIEFDKLGKPILPTIVCSPEAEPQFREVLEDPVTKLRIEYIIQRRLFERYDLWNLTAGSR